VQFNLPKGANGVKKLTWENMKVSDGDKTLKWDKKS
jgi:hypothetical protein